MRPQLSITISIAILSLSTLPTANAALLSRLGGQAVYDTDLDITWLANANLAKSNTFGVAGIDVDGSMDWHTANVFIAAMNADGGSGYLGFDDWRLPATYVPDPTCEQMQAFGWYCTASEMGHLYHIEGIYWDDPPPPSLFSNLHWGQYWSGTEYAADPSKAWGRGFDLEGQYTYDKDYPFNFAWAVRTGDVGEVPLPAAAWLFGTGLLGLVGSMRRRNSTR